MNDDSSNQLEMPEVRAAETVDHAKVVRCLASDLRDVYDPVLSKSLPIYFGPLLGELFLIDR
jgi:hypothetical protein